MTLARTPSLLLIFAAPLLAQDCANLLPLQLGNRWDYTITIRGPNGKETRKEATVHDEAACALADGSTLHQLRVFDGATTTFEYWSIGPEGVHRHPTQDRSRRGSFDEGAGMPILSAWTAPGMRWAWLGPHDLIAGEHHREFTHQAERLDDLVITVPAGTFEAVHVHIDSSHGGHVQMQRDLWFAPGVGIVRDEHRDALRTVRCDLRNFTPSGGDDEQRLRSAMAERLSRPGVRSWNNMPHVAWLEAGPEALQIPGRVAVVHTDAGTQCWFVGADRVHWFRPTSTDDLAGAVRAAFGSDSALVPDAVPLTPLALLLARIVAAEHHYGKVRQVEPTLAPPERLLRDSHRQACAEIEGGALDGTTRRIAVWITLRNTSIVQLCSDDPAVVQSTGR